MKLNDLKPAEGAKKSRRRVGRGLGSGRGKTAGRGQKGQKSRSGFSQGSGWEGGRSRLVERLPKRGFNRYNVPYQVVNLKDLDRFEAGANVNAESLAAVGLVGNKKQPIKLLGDGELSVKNLTIDVDAYSKSAVSAVEAAGGSVIGAEVVEKPVSNKKHDRKKREAAKPTRAKAVAKEDTGAAEASGEEESA